MDKKKKPKDKWELGMTLEQLEAQGDAVREKDKKPKTRRYI